MTDLVFVFIRHNEDKTRWWADLKTFYKGKGFSPWEEMAQTSAWPDESAAETAAIFSVNQFGGEIMDFIPPSDTKEDE